MAKKLKEALEEIDRQKEIIRQLKDLVAHVEKTNLVYACLIILAGSSTPKKIKER